jgi:hypothetical protein
MDEAEAIFKDQTVYLIGGGPSLIGFDWELLREKNVIAINRAFQVVPWAQVLYWTDPEFYDTFFDEIGEFRGLKICSKSLKQKSEGVIVLRGYNKQQLDLRDGSISHGNNSGFGALNLALKLGATKVFLLGFDGEATEDSTHWHDGYSKNLNPSVFRRLNALFASVCPQLKQLNIEVYNANPESSIRCFPLITLEKLFCRS